MSTETRCILRASALDPCSAYEFCVTSSRNLHIGDDSSTLNFNPFAEVPLKDFEEYAQLHKNFAWQLKRTDTDQENIILEATYRLIRYHDLTLRDIGSSGALIGFISSLDEPLRNYGELLKRLSLRCWPHIATHEIPQANTAPEASNIATRFETMMKAFCANLNCIETYCSPHADFSSPSGRPVHEESHKIPEPCGPHCFMLETKEDEIFMVKPAFSTYKQIVTVCPELTTCQLAVACWCKCKEDRPDVTLVFHLTYLSFCNRSILFKELQLRDDNPCDHDGPCDRRHNCACYKNKSYCEKGCRCSPSCTRRHPGCNCKLQAWNKLSCTSERCPCVKAWRECDPERCSPCKAQLFFVFFQKQFGVQMFLDHDGSGCYNAQIQAKATKAVIVQESQFGLGLFLRETAKKDALITEYVGELVFESSIASRDCVSKARNRNYVYELNNEISIDAGGFGNEARFINHSSNPNCSARSLLVNGEHRIGIYSGINNKKGVSEFTVSYTYWSTLPCQNTSRCAQVQSSCWTTAIYSSQRRKSNHYYR
ncbi:SET domain-containing protein [Schizopora paradoxa]|uniref:SET domain-containing protein n=1 Tax=Schizopora paradoxa TaxID=27342 RepID=A0A0H2RBH9_9AGAM|nr:SET domain-containing protein [Schizopora paradoxa]